MNIINYIFKKIYGILKSTMENRQKVADKIRDLNLLVDGEVWIEVDGYVAMTKVELGANAATFHANQGLPCKVFFNSTSGEIKLFPAKLFETE